MPFLPFLSLLSPAVEAGYAVVLAVAAVIPGSPGARLLLALAVVTVGVRAALLPLSLHGHRQRQRVGALQPQLAQVRRRHHDDPQRLLAETRRVYATAGVSPVAGLGSGLLQTPLLLTLYAMGTTAQLGGVTNVLMTTQLLGTPLSARLLPALLSAPLSPAALLLAGLLAALLALAALSATRAGNAPRLLRLLPFGTVVVAAVSPVALSAYLLSTTAWTLAERAALDRWA